MHLFLLTKPSMQVVLPGGSFPAGSNLETQAPSILWVPWGLTGLTSGPQVAYKGLCFSISFAQKQHTSPPLSSHWPEPSRGPPRPGAAPKWAP